MGKLNLQKLRKQYSIYPILDHHGLQFETEGRKNEYQPERLILSHIQLNNNNIKSYKGEHRKE